MIAARITRPAGRRSQKNSGGGTVLFDGAETFPLGFADLESFCAWAASPEFPRRGRYSFINGQVWMDLEMEQLFIHNLLKLQIAAVLHWLAIDAKLGYVFTDGAFLKNALVGLATEPDALFVSYKSIRNGLARLTEPNRDGPMVVEGIPEMTLEVISESSVRKDTVELKELYWRAGIAEYWLVDARTDEVQFDILRRGRKAFGARRKDRGGWMQSRVFGRSFRISRTTDELGNPQFKLEVNE